MSQDNVEINFKPSATVNTTSLVSYESRGHCLLVAPLEQGLDIAKQINCKAVTLLVHQSGLVVADKQATEDGVKVITVDALGVTGHLGAFDCAIGSAESPGSLAKMAGVSLLGGFDTVLDMSAEPMLAHEVLPFGYYAPGDNAQSLSKALLELAELEGEFEKPKYFAYDANICAHSRSGITACSNCIDVCGTGAIKSDGEGISVDPYLCQGCGSCSSSCPSGAITYAYPQPADAFTQLASLIKAHLEKELSSCVVYLHDAESGAERLAGIASSLHDAILPVSVEEVASIGMDGWFCALAYGASAVIIDAPTSETGMRRGLDTQIEIANHILQGLELDGRIICVEQPDAETLNPMAEAIAPLSLPAATFKTFNDKRQTIRMALDHLREHKGAASDAIVLPASAAFGQVTVDTQACTLCLACVTVCPARALQDGETLPQLKFIESNCLQCGLCEQACPEDAIGLSPRFLYDSELALKPAIVNEEKPFNCVVCNKPFATERIIGRMMTKLSGHWMFEDGKAKRRLKMCEDCRVMDIFESESGGIDVHKS